MKDVIIRTANLRKEYDGFVAVDNINLKVYRGEIFGLLGPNGAGKTTTISMLLGLVPPTSGDAWVDGFSVRRNPIEVRRRVGFLADNPGFYDNMTARENLVLTAKLNGVKSPEKRIKELLSRVGLEEWVDVEVGKFSRGMKQRLGIADALIKDPSVLILDEPTAGIDPKGSAEILSIIENLAREKGITVLMSSHLLHQVEKICDRVAIMSRGRIVAEGSLQQLLGGRITIEIEVEGDAVAVAEKLTTLGEVDVSKNRIRLRAVRDVRREVSRVLYESRVPVIELRVARPGLSEVYSRLVEEEEVP